MPDPLELPHDPSLEEEKNPLRVRRSGATAYED
jgi:hypothetical protein